MEKAGFIERRNDKNDERLTILQITRKGLDALDTIREIQERHIGKYLEAYSQADKEEILEILKHIVRTGKR